MAPRPWVAVVAKTSDPQAAAVASVLEALDARVAWLPLHMLDEGAPFTIVDGKGTFAGMDLQRVQAAYVKSIPSAWPPITHDGQGRAVVVDRWMTPWMWAREREAAAMSLLMDWHVRGVPLLNPPSPQGFAQNKPYQLQVARRLGLRIPRTCITNEPARARAFCRAVGRAIAKPTTGGALTRAVNQKTDFSAIATAPVILQERVDGDDVRLMMLEGHVLSCAAIRLPEGHTLDFRASDAYQQGGARYERVDLPARVVDQAAAWATACGLAFAGVDLKRTPSGRLVFLECNSSPVYLDQELKTGEPISACLAEWLWARARGFGK